MSTVLLVIHLLVAVALICVIMLQRSAQDGGGLMGGGATMGGLFTARGSANLLSRTTAILATVFIVLSLLLGFIATKSSSQRSIVDQIQASEPAAAQQETAKPAETTAPAPTAPKAEEKAAPSVPVSK